VQVELEVLLKALLEQMVLILFFHLLLQLVAVVVAARHRELLVRMAVLEADR
jgi:hypothetical protein